MTLLGDIANFNFETTHEGKRGNYQKGGGYKIPFRKGKSGDPSENLYDPAGYGGHSYGYYPPEQRRVKTNYRLGKDGQSIYGTDGFGGHHNIGLGGYDTRGPLTNDLVQRIEEGTYPQYDVSAYGTYDERPNRGDSQNYGRQQWLHGKTQKIRDYSVRYHKVVGGGKRGASGNGGHDIPTTEKVRKRTGKSRRPVGRGY